MNKYLKEIEINLSKGFGNQESIEFALFTRELVDNLYSNLKKSVSCKYGKLVFKLMKKESIESVGLNKYLFDDDSGVIIVHIPFNYEAYSKKVNLNEKKAMIKSVMIDELRLIPTDSCIDKEKT